MLSKNFKKIVQWNILFFTSLIIIAPSFISCSITTNWKTKFVSFIQDGDTLKTSDNTIYRLLGVDTPETFDGRKPTKGIERFYAIKAKEFVSRLLLNKNASFLEDDLDVYNRTVARIMINNKDVSLELVMNGLARVAYISCDPKNIFYYNDIQFIRNLKTNEIYAKNNKLGVWKNKKQIKQIFPKTNVVTPNSC